MPRASIDRFGRILVPKRLRDRLGLAPDTQVDLEVEGENLLVKPLPPEPTLRHDGSVLVAHVEAEEDLDAFVRGARPRP